ncbi:MAG TPA: hypothetical protein VI756_16785 [Blastocatellia bacterium]
MRAIHGASIAILLLATATPGGSSGSKGERRSISQYHAEARPGGGPVTD